METWRHRSQMQMLIDPLELAWAGRDDFFVGGNMFVYFSPDQVRTYDFRGPDVFVVLDVPRRERKSWLVWEEGKGPDVVVELMSESTAALDKGEKKLIYQNRLRVPEYFLYDPFSGEWAGYALHHGVYEELKLDVHGRFISNRLQLALVRWQGTYHDVEALWLRWATLDGKLLPTERELAAQAQQRAEQARKQAEQAEQRAEELQALLTRYRRQFGDLPE